MFAYAIDQLDSALDALGDDVATVADDQLCDAVDRLGPLLTRVEALAMEQAGEWERRQLWAADGSRSARAALARRWGLAIGAAGERLRVAGRLREAPLTRAASRAGELSYGKVRALTTAVAEDEPDEAKAAFRESEAVLVEACKSLSDHQVREVMAFWHAHADPNGERDDWNDKHDRRGLSIVETLDGMYRVEGLLDPESGQLVLRILQWIENQLWRADHPRAGSPGDAPSAAGDEAAPRTNRQRRADALREICRLASQYDRATDTFDGRAHDRPKVAVVVDAEALAGRAGQAYLADSHRPIPPETAERLVCDANLTTVLTDRRFVPLAVSHARGQVSPALRAALVLRDGRCAFPGCELPPRACDVHHIEHRARDGLHDLANTMLLCHFHHRLLHDERWRCWLDRATGRPVFRRPDGVTLRTDPSPLELAGLVGMGTPARAPTGSP